MPYRRTQSEFIDTNAFLLGFWSEGMSNQPIDNFALSAERRLTFPCRIPKNREQGISSGGQGIIWENRERICRHGSGRLKKSSHIASGEPTALRADLLDSLHPMDISRDHWSSFGVLFGVGSAEPNVRTSVYGCRLSHDSMASVAGAISLGWRNCQLLAENRMTNPRQLC